MKRRSNPENVRQKPARRKMRSLQDPNILERIREAEEHVQNGQAYEDSESMSAAELGDVIADLRARQHLDDHEA